MEEGLKLEGVRELSVKCSVRALRPTSKVEIVTTCFRNTVMFVLCSAEAVSF